MIRCRRCLFPSIEFPLSLSHLTERSDFVIHCSGVPMLLELREHVCLNQAMGGGQMLYISTTLPSDYVTSAGCSIAGPQTKSGGAEEFAYSSVMVVSIDFLRVCVCVRVVLCSPSLLRVLFFLHAPK